MKITLTLKALTDFSETNLGKRAMKPAFMQGVEPIKDFDTPFAAFPFKAMQLQRILSAYLNSNAEFLGINTCTVTNVDYNEKTKIITLT